MHVVRVTITTCSISRARMAISNKMVRGDFEKKEKEIKTGHSRCVAFQERTIRYA